VRSIPVIVVLLVVLASGYAARWLGPEQISAGDTHSGNPVIAFDPTDGLAWVVWSGVKGDTDLQFTRWLGDRWDVPRGVRPTPQGMVTRDWPSLAFEPGGGTWLVWCDMRPGITYDIGYSRWQDTCWAAEGQVNQPDSSDHDWTPTIACGGGQTWCFWDGGTFAPAPHSIYACRWDSTAREWGPEMQISPPDGSNHWLADAEVDLGGVPQVVWCVQPQRTVLHTFYDSGRWHVPVALNDTSRVTAGSRPRIVVDRDGVLHAAFPGAVTGAATMDVFYARNSGTGWTEPQAVTSDSAYSEWNCSIAARSTQDVWVAFTRQGEGPDEFRVYATHFDGLEWSTAERLDDDSTTEDFRPEIALDSAGFPWVVWQGCTREGSYHIYCSRHGGSSVDDEQLTGATGRGLAVATSTPVRGRVVLRCLATVPGALRVDVYDLTGRRFASRTVSVPIPGWRTVAVAEALHAGVYVCRVSVAGRAAYGKFAVIRD
jgi:hypothetical protein